ncbi:MAG TPA: hypothetical protein VL137_12755 [Polyangiaceae bacterium]|nr:hypothetical protein [Polyangiaceae bacterium]
MSATLIVGLLLASGPLQLLGAVLASQTHHRPLGAVTFALIAAVLIIVLLRIASRCEEQGGRLRLLCRLMSALSLGSVLLQLLLASPS